MLRESAEHNNTILELKSLLIPIDRSIKVTHDDVIDEFWKGYGFQNKNLRSDFRGGGYYALRNILDFTRCKYQLIP